MSLTGRTAIVTGAAAGLGRAEALALAARGATVVVNDIGEPKDVVEEIEAAGGKAVAVAGDVGERATADALTQAALDLGGLDIVVNNAGVLRDKMLFSMSDDDWDTVLRVHLRGHFLLSRNAAKHWRDRSKADGKPVYGRLVNTASEAFLIGSPGQPNYAAAKAGITALTMSAARGLAKYGVRANAICPRARTAMTEGVFGAAPAEGADPLSVEHVAPFVAYLASPAAEHVNGQVFVVHGGTVSLVEAPRIERRWSLDELETSVSAFFAERDPGRMFAATEILEES
ncbi:3-oxoacyl-[acyl-carrier protein] reductase [Amycolatopsis lexingtonensis]|uniref:3-oxoacyl-[acyl-carrier protein] reductase n=1 Tax=Amycolatopsis lexingtonensis TaxID=218822 RepID=A0ABR9I1Y9_9PSEU|nr:3-oxoacyl-ACP reductase [Amycolatopsis lexingtonensis]MBE1497180.1 3-oxoacyl-[acyl-carrier protein] reductase [Amycolatopsis lexingtonensis]